MRNLIFFFGFLLVGCATHNQADQNLKAPALQLAETSTRNEDLSDVLMSEFFKQLEFEQEYWRAELGKVLTGEQLEKALAELQSFNQKMVRTSESLTSDQLINQRVAEYFSKAFTAQELENLARLMSSPEWQKYQLVTRQMSLAPDTLGLRADFTKALEKERDLMGQRIFGENVVNQSTSANR